MGFFKKIFGRNKNTKSKNIMKSPRVFRTSGDFVEDQKVGALFEKKQDYKNAIKAYYAAIENAQNSSDGVVPPNPFMRLAIIYRKLKDRDKEIEVLREGIRLTKYPDAKTKHKKLIERLEKLENK